MRQLRITDLNEHGTKTFEAAYQEAARRVRCSRDDFAAGWTACAAHYGISVVFQKDAWREAHEHETADTADTAAGITV